MVIPWWSCASDEKNVVCKAEVGKVRVTVMLDKADSVGLCSTSRSVVSCCAWFRA